MAEDSSIQTEIRPNRRRHMNPLAVRFTIFSFIIVLLAIGLSVAVVHESRAVHPYQAGVIFR